MRWRGVGAVVRRDLLIVTRAKAVILPLIIVPFILLVGLPALAGLAPQAADAVSTGDVEQLIRVLPPSVLAGLPDDPGLVAGYVFVVYVLAPMLLILPIMFATVIAADAVAGERERGTLEALLLTPLSDRELFTGKMLAAWLPAVAVGLGGAVVYAITANLAIGTQLGRLVLPNLEFLLLVLWVGPTFSAASLGAVVLVSVRAESFQAATQLGGLVVLPVLVLVVAQATGVLLLSPALLAVVGAVAALAAVVLLRAGGRMLTRTRLGERLG